MSAGRTLKVLADYDCWALWVSATAGTVNADPADPRLGLSPDLVAELNRWAEEYTATLNRDDPAASGFPSEEAEREFAARGRRLAEAIRAQVGPEWRVTYYDSGLGRDVEIPGSSVRRGTG